MTTVLIVIPLSAAMGALLHHFIEKPFLTLRPKYIKT
ncbi:peptidoglycan/LPS O-acetylase OafA/YrhL [Rhizobium rosettiformans]|uniref:Peptidoglycan/LPS O-acetylase OafA/YrhL n=1 Tax=Rhizobium rosettiformans TaxID=1368430 RepID=A0A7W8HUS9_9HYPH|nr:peptidoglycan/LPS O-acetylase OafA/YrhL [Rhizobium rosettiformans]